MVYMSEHLPSKTLVSKMRRRIHDATNALPSRLNWEDLLAEAADEIERLRVALELITGTLQHNCRNHQECKRIAREALGGAVEGKV
jgi:hypothetical protein